MSRIALVASLCMLAACGGSTTPPANSLAGTWDVTVTGDGVGRSGILTGVVTLGASQFSAEFNNSSLTYQLGANTFRWTGEGVTDISTTHGAAAFDVGAFAFPLGGSWGFASQEDASQNCSANFSPSAIDLGCHLNHGALPIHFDESMNGTLLGTKGAARSSIFGDLGGSWTFTDRNGTLVGVMTFDDSTVSFNMSDDTEFRGQFSITFADGSATGASPQGLEVSARRR